MTILIYAFLIKEMKYLQKQVPHIDGINHSAGTGCAF